MTKVTSAPSRSQAKPLPPLEVLDELFILDPETGALRWRKASNRWGRTPAGTIAGSTRPDGYRYINLLGAKYLVHRIAFYMHHRREPVGEVDHRDTDPSNNRVDNLREASHSRNNCNRNLSSVNTSGIKGVHWAKRERRWRARIMVNRKEIHIGLFKSIEDAEAAVRAARERLHGEFAHHG